MSHRSRRRRPHHREAQPYPITGHGDQIRAKPPAALTPLTVTSNHHRPTPKQLAVELLKIAAREVPADSFIAHASPVATIVAVFRCEDAEASTELHGILDELRKQYHVRGDEPELGEAQPAMERGPGVPMRKTSVGVQPADDADLEDDLEEAEFV